MTSELIDRAQTSDTGESTLDSPRLSDFQRKHADPVSRMLRVRVPFLLIGVAIATFFFQFFSHSPSPIPDSLVDSELALPTRRVLLEESATNLKSKSGKVPAGVRGKRKRILVTGGAGFVGSHLVDRLIERGDSVIVIDNFFTGRKENLFHHFGNPNFELIRHDVVQPILLEVDQIYHLACPASPVHYKFNPVKTIISFLYNSPLLLLIIIIVCLMDHHLIILVKRTKIWKSLSFHF